MIKALCFDLDLTLVNSGMIILKSFDYAFSKCLKEKRKENLEDYLEYIGPPLKDSFMKNTNDPKKVDEMIETFNFYIQLFGITKSGEGVDINNIFD